MSDPRHIAEQYIATWNETDAQRRMALLRQHWNADARYADPLASVAGVNEISRLIGGVHERFPGFVFGLTGSADGHGEHVRFSWSLGPAGVQAPVEGSDVVVLSEGRISNVIGFLDKVPA
jgi:hypothetical protein